MSKQRTTLITALALASTFASAEAFAQESECTFEARDPADFSLSTELVGAGVSIATCEGQEYLFANLLIGRSAIAVTGPWGGSSQPTCLKSHFEEDPWPGFTGFVANAELCYDPATSEWSAKADTSASIAGGLVDLDGASFDWSAPSPSFALESLEVGPFTLSDVELGTETNGGTVTPTSFSGELSLGLPGGGTLAASAEIGPDSFGIGFDLANLPSDFPFPGITIPATKASLGFGKGRWNLEFSFSGTPSLGPLGEVPIDEGSLKVYVPDEGDWGLYGCLSSTPTDIPLGVVDFTSAEVDVCASTDGDAELSWSGSASFPDLAALGPIGSTGKLTKDGDDWTGTLAMSGAATAGPLGSLSLSGELSLAGTTQGASSVSGCLEGSGVTALPGNLPASLRFSLGDTCLDGNDFALSFDGTVEIADREVAAAGVMTLGTDSWATEAQLSNVAFGNFLLDDAKLALDSDGNANLDANLTVGAFPLHVTGQVQSGGAFSLGVSLRESVDLGNGMIIDDVAGSSLSYDGGVWSLSLNVAGSADIAGNAIAASGELDATFDEQTGEWTISGCADAETALTGLPLTSASGQICWSEGQPTFRVAGTLDVGGESLDVSGSYQPDPENPEELVLVLELTAQDGRLRLGPGVELENVRLAVKPDSQAFDLDANLCLGALCMDASGSYTVGGAGELDLALDVSGWQPFPQLAAFSGQLTGKITIDEAGLVTVRYQVGSSQSYAIAPGLTLTSVFAGGHVDSEGTWKLELGGSTDLAFGDQNFAIALRGSVDNTGVWQLAGASDIAFQPLEDFLGPDAFIVSNPAFTVEASSSGFGVEVRGDLAMQLIPNAPAIQTTIRGGAAAGSSTSLWFAGSLEGLELPGVGDEPWQLPALYFAASTEGMNDFDLFDTPEDDSDDVDLEQGVTLTTVADLPVALTENQPSMRLAMHLGQDGLTLSGTLDVDIDLIVPSNNVPTIDTVTFNSMTLDASISTTGKLEMGFEGTTSFTPSNQSSPLLANARLDVGYQAPAVIVSGQMSIAGRWVEPFGLPRVAIEDPAFMLGFAVTTSYPPAVTLSGIGFNGDGYWLKEGTWPANFDDSSVPPPSNVLAAGSTFYFELEPSASGICLGACLSLPPTIARLSLQNLALSELVDTANALKDGVRDMVLATAPADVTSALSMALPTEEFGPIDIDPFDMTVRKLDFYLSTHDIEPWPGIHFTPGVHANLDVNVAGHDTKLSGALSTDGLILEGDMEPISFAGFSLTGNPYSRYADLTETSYSYVRVTSSSALNSSVGTVEGWLKTDSTSPGTLIQKSSGGTGLQVGITTPVRKCSGAVCTNMAKARFYVDDGADTYELFSDTMDVSQWRHVAGVYDSGEIRLVVDGTVVATAERRAPAVLAGTNFLGYRLDAIDDVRLWNVAKSAEELAEDARHLPRSAHESSELLARYTFDLDSGSVAHNSRYYAGTKHHGSYYRSTQALDQRDQDMHMRLNLSISDPLSSGLEIHGGTQFDPRGDNNTIGFSTELLARVGEVTGMLYAPAIEILSLPSVGTFEVTGNGPNMQASDFDDGVFAGFDLMEGEFATTGALRFKDSSGSESTVATLDVRYGCPEGQTCASPNSHELEATGSIDWSVPTGLGGDLRLTGSGSYDSRVSELAINGQLSVFGVTASASDITVDPNGVHLRASVNPGAAVGFDLGNQTLELEYQYEPARLCGTGSGWLLFPGTSSYYSATTSACFGSNPSLSVSGSASSLWLGGIRLSNVNVGYANGALSLSGSVSIPGVYSGQVSGSYTSISDFSLETTGDVTLGGFRMDDASLTLTPSGFRASGSLDLKVATVAADVSIDRYGNFSLSGSSSMNLNGHQVAGVNYSLTEDGLNLSGSMSVLGNSWNFSGAVTSDGGFLFQGTKTLSVKGFSMASANVSLAHYTSQLRRASGQPSAGLWVQGELSLPYDNQANVSFSVSTTGSFTATAYQSINLKGWTLSSGRIRLTQSGLTFRGSLAFPGGSMTVDTSVSSSGYFYVSANPSLNMSGFSLTDTYLRFRSSDGLYLRGDVRLGTGRYQVSGNVSGLNSWELCTSSSVTPTTLSFLPRPTGQFCLKKYGSGARLTGDGTVRFHSRTFDASYRMSTSGGIEYLYVSEVPNSFSMMGVTISGRIRFKVENNVLKYFRWNGSLNVANVVDFSGNINLSSFRLCPSDFGVFAPPPWVSSSCAYLYF